jgi:hypothetical protein
MNITAVINSIGILETFQTILSMSKEHKDRGHWGGFDLERLKVKGEFNTCPIRRVTSREYSGN